MNVEDISDPAGPFEDEGWFHVLANGEGSMVLWPAFAESPAGWRIAFGAAGGRACARFVEESSLQSTGDS
jgi:MbtH protein